MYPIVLNLSGKRALVVGGGPVAERKVRGLLESVPPPDEVRVIAPAATLELQRLSFAGRIHWEARGYAPGDEQGFQLVFAATDSEELNAQIAAASARVGAWVNVATGSPSGGEQGAGDFIVPAMLRRGELLVAVATGGAGPSLAAALRDRIGALLGEEYEQLVAALGELRGEAQRRIGSPAARRAFLRRATAIALDEIAAGRTEELREKLFSLLEETIQREKDASQ